MKETHRGCTTRNPHIDLSWIQFYIFPPNRVWRGIGVEAINHPNFRISFPPPQHQKPKWSFWESFLCSLVSPLPLLYSLGLLQRWNLKDDLLASNTFIWWCGSSQKLPEPLIFSFFFNKWKRIVICFIALLVFYPIQQIEHLILNFLLSYTNGSWGCWLKTSFFATPFHWNKN